MNERPNFVKDDHILTLDYMRAAGRMANGNAKQYLMAAFPELSETVASAIVAYWLNMQKRES